MKDEVQEIRRKIILHSLNVLLAAMAPTFMLSVYRSLSIDWQATTTVHGGLLVVCITLFLFRHRISQVVIASFISLTFLLIGIAGYATLGMMSGGLAFSITAVLCSTALIGRRVGVGVLVFVVLLTIAFGYLHTSGRIDPSHLFAMYNSSVSSWTLVVAIASVTSYGAIFIMSGLLDGLDRLVHDLKNKTDALARALETIETTNKQLEEANKAKSVFLANMSHEIRTPMNGVVGMADLLSDTSLSNDQKLYVDTIRNSAEALLVIINDVLDYSKIEAEKLKLHPEPFDLERCVHEVVMLLQPKAREKKLEFLVDYDLFLPTGFVGDPGRIRQVLTNLMGNAVKFTQSGHVIVRVTGVPGQEGETAQVHIAVEDTGIGIPADMVGHVFGEFNQVENDRNRKFEGTGLGLAISKRLIELMGGQIWVDSVEGKGSTFGFRVPLPVSGAVEVQPPKIAPGLKRALVVDPSEAQRAVTVRQLEQLGLLVRAVPSAADALAEMESGRWDLVLIEQTMPEMDGFEFAEACRAKAWEQPILMMATNVPHAETDPARPLVQALIPRPVHRQDLLAALSACGAPAPFVEAQADKPQPVEHADAPAPVPQGRMRVLAAEDNRTNQLVFSKMLQDQALDLRFANNGEEAVAMAQSFQPELIFMDISMPVMDGQEATRRIRAMDGPLSKTPIVAMTAHAMEGDREWVMAAGLDAYLTKPLRKAQILEVLEKYRIKDLAEESPPMAFASRRSFSA